jgi:hypothetical protein
VLLTYWDSPSKQQAAKDGKLLKAFAKKHDLSFKTNLVKTAPSQLHLSPAVPERFPHTLPEELDVSVSELVTAHADETPGVVGSDYTPRSERPVGEPGRVRDDVVHRATAEPSPGSGFSDFEPRAVPWHSQGGPAPLLVSGSLGRGMGDRHGA